MLYNFDKGLLNKLNRYESWTAKDMRWNGNGLLEGNVLSGTDLVFTEISFYGEIPQGTFHIPDNYYLRKRSEARKSG